MSVSKILSQLDNKIVHELAVFSFIQVKNVTTVPEISESIGLPTDKVECSIFHLKDIDVVSTNEDVVFLSCFKGLVKHGLRPIDHSKELPGEYTEKALAEIMGGKKTKHSEKGHDIILSDLTKIECKMARLSGKQYSISGIGTNSIYDYLVAVLHPSETNYDITTATILFVPKREVQLLSDRKGMVKINESLCGMKYDWNKYKVTVEELKVIGRRSAQYTLNPKISRQGLREPGRLFNYAN
ncbi:hypothetical protein [Terribacillus saccharophilus]|uniref:Uncharacterized protein n=1 Tax=Terribacillus saccharophilus TaxID=361277 RepID=A0ABX4H0A6_9BACI|nr:hypothetical protein [Terribacillus saccharophilus]PAD35967.1 hypothetical protein CHH56_05950 [Terribacillus saccharophilus]PAD96983.1 hypothetical protein CHH50_06360 [Terribacillus saccharophilus]PAE00559.1 hypothetical protein CHH48_07265 [Terribacillus saccharophilus]